MEFMTLLAAIRDDCPSFPAKPVRILRSAAGDNNAATNNPWRHMLSPVGKRAGIADFSRVRSA
jgi:hypothetical protein